MTLASATVVDLTAPPRRQPTPTLSITDTAQLPLERRRRPYAEFVRPLRAPAECRTDAAGAPDLPLADFGPDEISAATQSVAVDGGDLAAISIGSAVAGSDGMVSGRGSWPEVVGADSGATAGGWVGGVVGYRRVNGIETFTEVECEVREVSQKCAFTRDDYVNRI